MVQEHHKHSKQSMGRINGYSMVFSPAQVTHVKKRRKGKGNAYHTKGGVAILYKPRLTRFLQPGVDMVGHNWCALIMRLAKNRVLNLVTSYIPHGTTQDGSPTVVEQGCCTPPLARDGGRHRHHRHPQALLCVGQKGCYGESGSTYGHRHGCIVAPCESAGGNQG